MRKLSKLNKKRLTQKFMFERWFNQMIESVRNETPDY
jgi:hypothetical protein